MNAFASLPRHVDQSSKDLRLSATEGLVDASQFTIVASRTAVFGDVKATLHILGESHCVILEGDGFAFTETLSCAPSIIQPEGCVHRTRSLSKSDDAYLRAASDFGSYKGVVKIADSDQKSEAELLAEDSASITLSHVFPSSDFSKGKPITAIKMTADQNGDIHWTTLHAYPQENRTAISTSSWSRARS